MENVNDEKVYFIPGNIVTLKHALPNAPTMLVQEVVNNKNAFKGIKCIWFTTGQNIQEAIFSTKDLVKI
jgi:uncharacterized protein YodC (DUF2158 family)